jgi:hypothetical protein
MVVQLKADLRFYLAGDGPDLLNRESMVLRPVGEELGRLGSRDKLHLGKRPYENDQVFEILESLLALFRSLHRGQLPIRGQRVRAVTKVHRVPEFPVHELARVKIQADHSALFAGSHGHVELFKLGFGIIEV